jgi:hypothetical protein
MKARLLAILAALMLFGCMPYEAYYLLTLKGVESSPGDGKWQAVKPVTPSMDGNIPVFVVQDEIAEFTVKPFTRFTAFTIRNKTALSGMVSVAAAFVDPQGECLPVEIFSAFQGIPGGAVVSEGGKPGAVAFVPGTGAAAAFSTGQPSSGMHIVKGEWAYFWAAPLNRVRHANRVWEISTALPLRDKSYRKLKAESDAMVGKEVRMLLRLSVKDVLREYLFTFSIDRAHVQEAGEVTLLDYPAAFFGAPGKAPEGRK